jgi:hypothetical protein
MQQRYLLGDIQDLFLFPFRDRESRNRLWIAIALTFAGFLIPILPNLLVMGYAGLIMRKMIVDKEEPSMPEWDNWSELLSLGFRLFSIVSIYILPLFLAFTGAYLLLMLPMFAPIFFISDLPTDEAIIAPVLLGTFGGLFLFALGMLLLLPTWLFLAPGLGHAVAKDSFSAAFQFREWWGIFKANKGIFFISLLVSWGLYSLLMFAFQALYTTVVLCALVPVLFTVVGGYLSIVVFVLFAQAYREAVAKMEA